jgi:hypothetical protein
VGGGSHRPDEAVWRRDFMSDWNDAWPDGNEALCQNIMDRLAAEHWTNGKLNGPDVPRRAKVFRGGRSRQAAMAESAQKSHETMRLRGEAPHYGISVVASSVLTDEEMFWASPHGLRSPIARMTSAGHINDEARNSPLLRAHYPLMALNTWPIRLAYTGHPPHATLWFPPGVTPDIAAKALDAEILPRHGDRLIDEPFQST